MRHAFRTITACSALLFATQATAACERHVYNNSDTPWTIFGWTQAVDSHIYFGDFCGGVRDSFCVLPPHSVMTITYSTTAGLTSVNVVFVDANRMNSPIFLTGGTAGNCPKTRHEGSTGAVSVNEPADGDFTIDANTWDGRPPPPAIVPAPIAPGVMPPGSAVRKPMPAAPPADGKTGTVTVP